MSNKNRQQSFNKHKEVEYTDEQILTNALVIDQTPEDKNTQVIIATPIPDKQIKQGIVYNCINLNIRKEASIEALVLCVIPCNDILEVMTERGLNPKWSKVKTKDGIIGFCMNAYIK